MPYGGLRYWLLPLLRARVRSVNGLTNLPSGGGFLLAVNHNAWVDSPLLVGALYRHLPQRVYFISRSHRYASLGSVTIHPDHPSGVIPACLDLLNKGRIVVVYPEGASNPLPILQRPKTGIARLAHLSGLPVVPVGIRGTFGITVPASCFCFLAFWQTIRLEIGAPLQFPKIAEADQAKDQLEKTANRIMEAISPLAGKSFAAPSHSAADGDAAAD